MTTPDAAPASSAFSPRGGGAPCVPSDASAESAPATACAEALKPQPRRAWRLILRAPKAGEIASAEISAEFALRIIGQYIYGIDLPGAAEIAHELSLSKNIRHRMAAAGIPSLDPEDAVRLADDPCRCVRETLASNIDALPHFAYAYPGAFAGFLQQEFSFACQIGTELGGGYVETLFESLPEEEQTTVALRVIRRRIAAAADALDAGLRASGRPERQALADYLAATQDDEYGDLTARLLRDMAPPKPPRSKNEPDALPVERPLDWRELQPDPERFAVESPGGAVVEALIYQTPDIARDIPAALSVFFKAMRRSPDPELRRIAAQRCASADEARELLEDAELGVRIALLENDRVVGKLSHDERLALLGGDEALWAELLRSAKDVNLQRSITDACCAQDPEVAEAIRAKAKALDELSASDDDDDDDDDGDDFSEFLEEEFGWLGSDDEDEDEDEDEDGDALREKAPEEDVRAHMPTAAAILGL